ncbi:MAG: molybdenum cofactor sulfurase [Erythrobacter sp.]|nr:MAG: molybdenum cofactor sulfurase [Erythrobacter sp.]
MSRWLIAAVCTGTARPFRGTEDSAIAKQARSGSLALGRAGLEGDMQADARVHGGAEMALHLYPRDHHAWWRAEIGDHPLLGEPGAFGSNLAVRGLTEEMVHIGDRFRCGTALIEVSRPRAPCWKIEHRFARPGMVAKIIATGRCGWYFRVIETGAVAAGDRLERVALGPGEWSVARVFRALVAGEGSAADYAALAVLEALSPALRAKAAAKRA